jgi:hypothetical protein
MPAQNTKSRTGVISSPPCPLAAPPPPHRTCRRNAIHRARPFLATTSPPRTDLVEWMEGLARRDPSFATRFWCIDRRRRSGSLRMTKWGSRTQAVAHAESTGSHVGRPLRRWVRRARGRGGERSVARSHAQCRKCRGSGRRRGRSWVVAVSHPPQQRRRRMPWRGADRQVCHGCVRAASGAATGRGRERITPVRLCRGGAARRPDGLGRRAVSWCGQGIAPLWWNGSRNERQRGAAVQDEACHSARFPLAHLTPHPRPLCPI